MGHGERRMLGGDGGVEFKHSIETTGPDGLGKEKHVIMFASLCKSF